MDQGICHISQIPLRGEPKSSSEMVSQLLFGESYEVLSKQNDWYKIKMHYDGYEGWISDSSIFLQEEFSRRAVQSRLCVPSKNDIYGGKIISSIGSEVVNTEYSDEEVDISEIAKSLLGCPYLWGGRHFSGIDCSGFVQVVFKVMGKKLPRDASQQQKIGNPVSFDDLYVGDLIYFEKDFKIGHVGLYLGNEKIIHSHGCVRVDRLTKKGIINSESGLQTHQYHSAKRLPFSSK